MKQNNKNLRKIDFNSFCDNDTPRNLGNDETQTKINNEMADLENELIKLEIEGEDNLFTVGDINRSEEQKAERAGRREGKKFKSEIMGRRNMQLPTSLTSRTLKLGRNKAVFVENFSSLPEFSKVNGQQRNSLSRNIKRLFEVSDLPEKAMTTAGFASLEYTIPQEQDYITVYNDRSSALGLGPTNINDISLDLDNRSLEKARSPIMSYNNNVSHIKHALKLSAVKENEETLQSFSNNNSNNLYNKVDETHTPDKLVRHAAKKNTMRKYQRYQKINCRNLKLFQDKTEDRYTHRKLTDLSLRKYSHVFSDVNNKKSKADVLLTDAGNEKYTKALQGEMVRFRRQYSSSILQKPDDTSSDAQNIIMCYGALSAR